LNQSAALRSYAIYVKRERAMSKWTVWVGGSEVNLCYLSQQQAENMVQAWIDEGYEEVVIEEIK
jgi:hypothetical protein